MSAVVTGSADIQERLSLAYLTAIAARAGCEVHEVMVDRNGIDATIRPISGAPVSLDVQMKATKREIRIESGNVLSYQLDTNTYDKLRRTDVQAPQLLVIYEMPVSENEWLQVSPDHTYFASCGILD